MFWENFVNLCNSVGKSPNGIAKDINVSSGAITSWKKGKVPHHSTLLKIANYFNVSVDYLLTGKNEPPADADEADNDISKEIMQKLPQLNDSDQETILRYINLMIMEGKR